MTITTARLIVVAVAIVWLVAFAAQLVTAAKDHVTCEKVQSEDVCSYSLR